MRARGIARWEREGGVLRPMSRRRGWERTRGLEKFSRQASYTAYRTITLFPRSNLWGVAAGVDGVAIRQYETKTTQDWSAITATHLKVEDNLTTCLHLRKDFEKVCVQTRNLAPLVLWEWFNISD